MFCPHCASNVSDDALNCPSCGKPLPQFDSAPAAPVQTASPEVKDYLTLNIVLLVITCLCVGCTPALVTGILGVIFSLQAKDMVRDGKLSLAVEKSRLARIMAICTGALIAATVLFIVVYFVLFFAFYGLAFSAIFAELGSTLGALML